MSDLESILRRETGVESDKPAVEPEQAPEVPVAEAEVAETEVETAEEPVKAKEEPKAPPPGDDGKVPISALLDEREKRQLYERQLREYEEKQRKAQEPQKVDLPDVFDDPEGFRNAIDGLVNQRVGQAVTMMRQQMETYRLTSSEEAARARYEDFETALKAFEEEAKSNPLLPAQMIQSRDPGEYVYQTGRKLMALRETPDLGSLRKQIEAEVRATLERERAEKEGKLKKVPGSLSNEQSAAGGREAAFTPTPIGDIVGRRR